MSKSAILFSSPWSFGNSFSFNLDVMLNHKKLCFSMHHISGGTFASLCYYYIQARRASTIHTPPPPHSSTPTPTPAISILQETDRFPLILLCLLLYLSKTLLCGKNNYSLGDNIALRKFLADADVLTSGQHSQNPGGPDRPGATRSRNVKVEGFSTDERSREEGERERGEKKRAQNSIKQVRSAA